MAGASPAPPEAPGRQAAGRRAFHLLSVTDHGRQVVARRCQASAAAGVTEGMALAHARSLLPPAGVVVEAYRPQRDGDALRALAQWAMRFSPRVAVDGADGLLIDAGGLDRLYGGPVPLANRVAEGVRQLGFANHVAVAPTIGCAWAAARFGGRARAVIPPARLRAELEPLPLAALRLEPAVIEALAEVGVRHVRELMALPAPAVHKRFGPNVLLRLDQALGQAWEAIDPVHPPEGVRVERTFAGPVCQPRGIELATRGLLDALCKRLADKQIGARRLEVELVRFEADPERFAVTLSRANRDARHLWSLLSMRLERANLGYGVERIILAANEIGRLRHEQATYLPASHHDGRPSRELGELLDVMANRLGPDRVAEAQSLESHVPERAFRLAPAGRRRERPAGKAAETKTDHSHPPVPERPSMLFVPPEPVEVMAVSPDGPVLQIRWRGRPRRLVTCRGPERIAPEWWAELNASPIQDESPRRGTSRGARPGPRCTRDYFRAQDDAGRWLWLYRECETARWFIHGQWA